MIKLLKHKLYNLLRASQRYTKTDMVYLARGSFWLNLGNSVSAITGVLLAIAFANLLPPETYGAYTTILSMSTIIAIPTLIGMKTPIIKAVAQGYEGTLLPAIATRLRWGTLSAVASLAVAGYYYINGNEELTLAFLLVGLFTPFMHALSLSNSYLSGKKKFREHSLFNISRQLIQLGVMVGTLYITNNLLLVIVSFLGTRTLLRFISFQIIVQKYRLKNRELSVDEEAISLGKHLSLMNIMGVISKNIDKVLIWHFLGPVQVATYSFAVAPPNHITKLFQPISSLALPKFSKQKNEILKQSIPQKILKIFIFSVPITVAYVLLAPFIYELLFPQYLDSVPFSQIFSLIILTQGSKLFSPYFHSQAQKKQLYIINISSPSVRILLMLLLLPLYGIMGIVIALLLSEVFNFLLRIYLMKKS